MEKIEQVARAIFKADYPRDDWNRFKPGDVVNERYLLLASAAIEAMKEPTPELFLKGAITDAYEAGYRIDPETGKITTKAD